MYYDVPEGFGLRKEAGSYDKILRQVIERFPSMDYTNVRKLTNQHYANKTINAIAKLRKSRIDRAVASGAPMSKVQELMDAYTNPISLRPSKESAKKMHQYAGTRLTMYPRESIGNYYDNVQKSITKHTGGKMDPIVTRHVVGKDVIRDGWKYVRDADGVISGKIGSPFKHTRA